MTTIPYSLDPDNPAARPLGLIVLQVDETIEPEFRDYFSDRAGPIYVSRIPSALTVTRASLAAMASDLVAAADRKAATRLHPDVAFGIGEHPAESGLQTLAGDSHCLPCRPRGNDVQPRRNG